MTLRVRLTPNSSCCCIGEIWLDNDGAAYLQVKVRAVPEKGKANAELIKLMAAELGVAKSRIEVMSGITDRYKKLAVSGNSAELVAAAAKMMNEES